MIQIFKKQFDDIVVTTDKSLLNISFIHHYLSTQTYWAANIPLNIVEDSIEHSLCFGVYKNNAIIGFARMVTDYATFGYLADVFIVENERGKGYSKLLMQTINEHPNLQILRRLMLATRDAHLLYQQFGWNNIDEIAAQRIMQKLKAGY